jgi:AhpD family alkylhydroperoxidase
MTKRSSLTFLIAIALFASAAADTKPNPAQATLKEIEAATGFVPDFIRQMPPALLPSFWDSTKSFEMNPNTALDGKTKQLIGLAVAASIPCDYCVLYHTEAAKAEGATKAQIQEAVAMAALTRQGSTLLNGLQIDHAQFKKDIDRLMKGPKK